MENVFDLTTKRHSLAHLLAQALQRFIDPQVQLGTGPRTDTGFYYDVLFSAGITLSSDQLKDLTKKIQFIAKEPQTYLLRRCPLDQGYEINALTRQTLKNELLDKFKAAGETEITYYLNVVPLNTLEHARDTLPGYKEMYTEVSDFMRFKKIIGDDQAVVYIDLCAGPHVETTKDLDPSGMVIEKLAGAYRQADENNVQMTRIYGLAFENKEALNAHLAMLEEAKKRDHRVLGKQLELFAFDDEVGPGLPLWLPNGTIIVEELERLAKEKEATYGYVRVRTPHITKDSLYLKSGHLPYYADSMFPPMEMDGEKYYLKPMNCPHHHKCYAATPKSYRDLPLRLAEYGHCYRYEDSGSLFGLMRVRSLCMNDAHIYCTEEQFEDEFVQVIRMYLEYFQLFGIEKYQMRLSKHSKEWLGKKYVDNEKLWIATEDKVRKALIACNVPFVEAEDEAAFYGPKIDVQIRSVIGREFTLATNQLDFAVPERFNLTYIDKDWQEKTPLCIHRAPLSTHERFIGFLIEHFAGAFPLWLAPTQVTVLPVSDSFNGYAQSVVEACKKEGIRISCDDSAESLNKKIRNAELMKIPYMLIIGEKEIQDNTVSVRVYKTKEQYTLPTGEFVRKVVSEFKERTLS